MKAAHTDVEKCKLGDENIGGEGSEQRETKHTTRVFLNHERIRLKSRESRNIGKKRNEFEELELERKES